MNGVDNLELFRRFCLKFPQLLPRVIFHAVRGKFVWSGNSETVSRKYVEMREKRTIRKFRIVGLEAAMGFKSDLSRWNLP